MDKLKFLLQIKRWKLFCLFLSIGIFRWIPFFETYITPLIFIIWFAWVISIGYNGQDLIKEDLEIKWLTKKKFVIRVILITATIISSFVLPNELLNSNDDLILVFLIPIGVIEGYCAYYILIAAAVIITTIEYKQKANFWASLGHFLRLLCFPLGVFGIQAILNKEFQELY